MQLKIDGKICTLSVTVSRFKACIILLIAGLMFGLPIHSCNVANQKLKNTPAFTNTVNLTEPIVSPYNLDTSTKSTLKHWLHYGYENGYSDMMNEYDQVNGNSETAKLFRYLIDTEWRLGFWERMRQVKLTTEREVESHEMGPED